MSRKVFSSETETVFLFRFLQLDETLWLLQNYNFDNKVISIVRVCMCLVKSFNLGIPFSIWTLWLQILQWHLLNISFSTWILTVIIRSWDRRPLIYSQSSYHVVEERIVWRPLQRNNQHEREIKSIWYHSSAGLPQSISTNVRWQPLFFISGQIIQVRLILADSLEPNMVAIHFGSSHKEFRRSLCCTTLPTR